jgi:hypothetical protein
MENIDPQAFAEALSRLLRRFADAGWVASTRITPGRLYVEYTPRGRERMEQLRDIITKELHAALKFDEFQALMGLILRLDSNDLPPQSPPSCSDPAPKGDVENG